MSNSDEANESQRYNILFLTTDQTYAHAPRPEGYELPNRQRLEDAGLVFDSYQVNTALCTPSRSAIYTGVHYPGDVAGGWLLGKAIAAIVVRISARIAPR